MIVVMNRITVAEGRHEEFEENFGGRELAVHLMPGFVDLEVLRPQEGSLYIVLTRWKTRQDFEQWTQSEVFLAAHKKQTPGVAAERPTLEIYEVLTH